jgi:hypothetical protein
MNCSYSSIIFTTQIFFFLCLIENILKRLFNTLKVGKFVCNVVIRMEDFFTPWEFQTLGEIHVCYDRGMTFE